MSPLSPSSRRGRRHAALALAAALVATAGAALAAEPTRLPPDAETTVGGIGLACTGIGEAVRDEPRWRRYPLKLAFADKHAHLVATEQVTVSDDKGGPLLRVRCGGAWLLLDVPRGRDYRVVARLVRTRTVVNAAAHAPKTGQNTVVLVFPDAP